MSTPPRGNDAPFSSATTVPGAGADTLATGGADAVLAREHAARVCAEALVFSRDRVLSLVSHDLRGPLNAIHSWAHVLERKLAVDDPGIARAIAGIRTGVEQQVKLIEEVIDQTRKETRHLTLSLTAVPLLPCVAGELDSIERTLPVESASGIRRGFALEGVTATLDAPRFAQAWWTVVMYALAQRVIGTVVEASGMVEGDRIEVAVVFTPRPEDDPGAVATGTPSPVSADRDGGTESLAAYTAFLNAPRQLDNGKLPLALAQRVAVAHGGELIDEMLADSRRRLALRQPVVARPPQY